MRKKLTTQTNKYDMYFYENKQFVENTNMAFNWKCVIRNCLSLADTNSDNKH